MSQVAATADTARIAIIIDDIGYRLNTGLRAAKFPAKLTLSVLPYSPNGVALARIGHSLGKEIMLHAPMSSTRGLPLDKGGLTGHMNRADFNATLTANLKAIPHVSGVNNHMGSRLTQKAKPMRWLMEILQRHQLYFVDSRTSANSLAFKTACTHQLPSLQRDIFLDNQRDAVHIRTQLAQLILLARSNGYALGIGHPYPETLDVLAHQLPNLDALGIELVAVSSLLQTNTPCKNR